MKILKRPRSDKLSSATIVLNTRARLLVSRWKLEHTPTHFDYELRLDNVDGTLALTRDQAAKLVRDTDK